MIPGSKNHFSSHYGTVCFKMVTMIFSQNILVFQYAFVHGFCVEDFNLTWSGVKASLAAAQNVTTFTVVKDILVYLESPHVCLIGEHLECIFLPL